MKKLATEKLDANNDLVKMLNSLGARAAAFTIRDKQVERLLSQTMTRTASTYKYQTTSTTRLEVPVESCQSRRRRLTWRLCRQQRDGEMCRTSKVHAAFCKDGIFFESSSFASSSQWNCHIFLSGIQGTSTFAHSSGKTTVRESG